MIPPLMPGAPGGQIGVPPALLELEHVRAGKDDHTTVGDAFGYRLECEDRDRDVPLAGNGGDRHSDLAQLSRHVMGAHCPPPRGEILRTVGEQALTCITDTRVVGIGEGAGGEPALERRLQDGLPPPMRKALAPTVAHRPWVIAKPCGASSLSCPFSRAS